MPGIHILCPISSVHFFKSFVCFDVFPVPNTDSRCCLFGERNHEEKAAASLKRCSKTQLNQFPSNPFFFLTTHWPSHLLQAVVLSLHPRGVVRGVAGDEVADVLLVVRLKHERLLRTACLRLVAQLQCHVVVVGVDGDGVDVEVLEVVDDVLVLGAHELDAVHVDGQEGLGGVWPQTLVHDGEQRAAIQRELLDACQVPHLCLQLALVCSVMLHPWGGGGGGGSILAFSSPVNCTWSPQD